MKLTQFTKTESEQNTIYIGIDVHKKSWQVSILGDFLELKSFSQPPEPKVLAAY